MAHVRQSRPDSGLGFEVKALKRIQIVPFLCSVDYVRGGLVFKAHRLCVSLNSRLVSNKEEEEEPQTFDSYQN